MSEKDVQGAEGIKILRTMIEQPTEVAA